jgi:hypothetical protein
MLANRLYTFASYRHLTSYEEEIAAEPRFSVHESDVFPYHSDKRLKRP